MSEKLKSCPFCGAQLDLRCNGVLYCHDEDSGCFLSSKQVRILKEKIPMSGWNTRARSRRAPTTIEDALSVPEVYRALSEAMIAAKMLAHSYERDSRPNLDTVARSLTYPVDCTPAGLARWLAERAKS